MSQNMLHEDSCGAAQRERAGLSAFSKRLLNRTTESTTELWTTKLTLLSLSPVLSSLDIPKCSKISPITLGH